MMNIELLMKVFGGRLPLAPKQEVSQDETSCFGAAPSSGEEPVFPFLSPQRPVTICVTGQMAAGKNFISSIIEKTLPSAVTIDLDQTVHTAIELCRDQIVTLFGNSILNKDGSINRRQIGSLVFSNPELLAKQESIVYPKVIELTEQFMEEAAKKGSSVIINATVLYKTPQLMDKCDFVLFITAPEETRLNRAMERDNLTKEQILQRFQNQADLYECYQKTGKPIITLENP